jgi:hypothetical protein
MNSEKKITPVYLNDFQIIGPGFSDTQQVKSILSGTKNWQSTEMEKMVADCLPANERRRTTPIIKLAIQLAQQTVKQGDELISPATVFASSDGDFSIVDNICSALCEPGKNVSPTQFHNSVHNAPAGYWAIAAKCQLSSTSISAGDASFAAGLLEAMTQVYSSQQPVLFIGYDYPAPFPLDEKRHFEFPFGVALLLSAEKQDETLAELSYTNIGNKAASICDARELADIQNGNPIAHVLPLLECVSRKESKVINLPYYDQSTLEIQVTS